MFPLKTISGVCALLLMICSLETSGKMMCLRRTQPTRTTVRSTSRSTRMSFESHFEHTPAPLSQAFVAVVKKRFVLVPPAQIYVIVLETPALVKPPPFLLSQKVRDPPSSLFFA